jgi:gluconokinase
VLRTYGEPVAADPTPDVPPPAHRVSPAHPVLVVVAGVTGSGKTTIGRQVAERLGVPFADGDDFHDPAAVEQMRAGRPLTEDDRRPWLARCNAQLRRWHDAGTGGVLAC